MSTEGTVPLVLSVKEAGKLLGLSRGLMYEAVRSGQLPSIRIGRRILIPRAALERLLERGGIYDTETPRLEVRKRNSNKYTERQSK